MLGLKWIHVIKWALTKRAVPLKWKCCHFGEIFVISCAKVTDLQCSLWRKFHLMMTSSNGNIFRITGPLCGKFTGPGEFPAQRPVTRSFDVFFDLRPNKRLSKQPWGWWFETPSWSLWCQCNVNDYFWQFPGAGSAENFVKMVKFPYQWWGAWKCDRTELLASQFGPLSGVNS